MLLSAQPFYATVLLSLTEQRLEVLYGPIRYKMATALNNWHPSDSSAHKILEPWVKVRMTVSLPLFQNSFEGRIKFQGQGVDIQPPLVLPLE